MALLTEKIQAEKRREDEGSLRQFQYEVRHRVAQQAQVSKKRLQLQTDLMVKNIIVRLCVTVNFNDVRRDAVFTREYFQHYFFRLNGYSVNR